MGARLVSLFGIGDSESVKYELDKYPTKEPTPLIQHAIVERYSVLGDKAVTSVVLIGTKEARENYRTRFALEGALLERAFRGAFDFTPVGSGEDEEGQREVFSTLVRWLSPEALSEPISGFNELQAPSEIILDITHGLKPQALIAGAAVTFVFAERVRKGLKDAPPIRVLYGRHDPGDGEGDANYTADIWDLTEYVTTTLWTLALQATRFGQAEAANVLADQASQRQVRESQQRGLSGSDLASDGYPRKLGKALLNFTEALTHLRAPLAIADTAPRLVDLLADDARTKLQERIPVLRDLLNELEKDAKSISSSKVLDDSGLGAMIRLSEMYGRMGRFAEQAGTLREAYVTYFGLNHVDPSGFVEPGNKGARKDREAVEQAMRSALSHINLHRSNSDSDEFDAIAPTVAEPNAPSRMYDGEAGKLLELLNEAMQVRNDILHLGLRDDMRSVVKLDEALGKLTKALSDMVNRGDPE